MTCVRYGVQTKARYAQGGKGEKMRIGLNGMDMEAYRIDRHTSGKTGRNQALLRKTEFARAYEEAVSEEPELEEESTKGAAEKKEEAKTETDVIVKPDGSRVLVMTTHIGSMSATVSLKISEPTDLPNDHVGKENISGEKNGDGHSNVTASWQGTI